jgi:hypothetical protein
MKCHHRESLKKNVAISQWVKAKKAIVMQLLQQSGPDGVTCTIKFPQYGRKIKVKLLDRETSLFKCVLAFHLKSVIGAEPGAPLNPAVTHAEVTPVRARGGCAANAPRGGADR